MKLCECKGWIAVHFKDRTILRADCRYLPDDMLRELAETEVEPIANRKGHYKVKEV